MFIMNRVVKCALVTELCNVLLKCPTKIKLILLNVLKHKKVIFGKIYCMSSSIFYPFNI